MTFDWDDANRNHLARHNISAMEVEQVLRNSPVDIDIHDDDDDVVRLQQVGETSAGRILVVISTWRDSAVRVITGWDAPRADKALYLKRKATTEWNPS